MGGNVCWSLSKAWGGSVQNTAQHDNPQTVLVLGFVLFHSLHNTAGLDE
uniref:Uncharacterized protein n=1 Tax=Anguilla anguilla TaxID=7936 RepID=A0A0E9VAA7_ANGAN